MKPPTRANIAWAPAYRLIATRFPAVDLWAEAAPELWDRLDQIEALTNPRLIARHGGDVSYITWPFDNPRPGRFSTDSLGAFYAAQHEHGAVAETVYYQAIRCKEDRLDPHDFDMRVLAATISGRFHDLRGKRADAFPGVMSPTSHRASRALAEELQRIGSQGVVFSSVRDPKGCQCVAAFDPSTILGCTHLRYLTYRWDGAKVLPLYEKKPLA